MLMWGLAPSQIAGLTRTACEFWEYQKKQVRQCDTH